MSRPTYCAALVRSDDDYQSWQIAHVFREGGVVRFPPINPASILRVCLRKIFRLPASSRRQCRCWACGYEWIKKVRHRPRKCPRCLSPNWWRQSSLIVSKIPRGGHGA